MSSMIYPTRMRATGVGWAMAPGASAEFLVLYWSERHFPVRGRWSLLVAGPPMLMVAFGTLLIGALLGSGKPRLAKETTL